MGELQKGQKMRDIKVQPDGDQATQDSMMRSEEEVGYRIFMMFPDRLYQRRSPFLCPTWGPKRRRESNLRYVQVTKEISAGRKLPLSATHKPEVHLSVTNKHIHIHT